MWFFLWFVSTLLHNLKEPFVETAPLKSAQASVEILQQAPEWQRNENGERCNTIFPPKLSKVLD